MKNVLYLCMLTLLSASLVNSQDLATGKSTAQFLTMCEFVIDNKKQPENFEIALLNSGLCLGYIAGFLDSIPVMQSVMAKKLFCLPTSGVKATDVLDAMSLQLKKDPSMLNESVRSIMFISLRAEYPCR